MIKFLVCGSREWTNKALIEITLSKVINKQEDIIISGGASGADTIAHEWADRNKVDTIQKFAKCDSEGKIAGTNRNEAMLELRPDVILAFHNDIANSKGTGHMVRIGRKKCRNVFVITEHAEILALIDSILASIKKIKENL